jgi:hypothetical protein
MQIENLKIQNEDDNQIMMVILNVLLDNIGQNETHNLLPLMHAVGEMVSEYETENCPIPEFTGTEEEFLTERIALYEAQEINPDNPFYNALDDVYNLAMDAHSFYNNSYLHAENGTILQEQKNALGIVHDYLINHPLAD